MLFELQENIYHVCYYVAGIAPQVPGYYDKKGRFVFIPEMVPEFIVPDLTNFTVSTCTVVPFHGGSVMTDNVESYTRMHV